VITFEKATVWWIMFVGVNFVNIFPDSPI